MTSKIYRMWYNTLVKLSVATFQPQKHKHTLHDMHTPKLLFTGNLEMSLQAVFT